MKERLVHFTMFGQEFTFYSDAPEDEVEKVVELLRSEIEGERQAKLSTVPSPKILVLGCLRLAAKYIELDKEFTGFKQQQGKSIDDLINKVTSEID